MGIFGALTTSVAGLRAQSYALENISGNIANSQTTAFKRIDTSFLDLIPDTGVNNQLAGSVTTASRETNTVQGDVQTASVSTYMAINGAAIYGTHAWTTFGEGVQRGTRTLGTPAGGEKGTLPPR
jgi:flagellar hook protein FlgE